MTPAPHPLRCETCKKYDTKDCPVFCGVLDYGIRLLTSDIGCASHSSATSAEQVIGRIQNWNDENRKNFIANNCEWLCESLDDVLFRLRAQHEREP
jgi:hypothetical protein